MVFQKKKKITLYIIFCVEIFNKDVSRYYITTDRSITSGNFQKKLFPQR